MSRTGDYNRYKAFLAFYADRYMSVAELPPEHHPVACLESLEKRGRAIAAKGLSQAINDIIASTAHLDLQNLKQIDRGLKARGLISLSELRKCHSRHYRAVCKRRKIKNEVEYYLVRGIVEDGSLKLENDERASLTTMLSLFENDTLPPSR